eukprot:Gb_08207 [translate_table: standard]
MVVVVAGLGSSPNTTIRVEECCTLTVPSHLDFKFKILERRWRKGSAIGGVDPQEEWVPPSRLVGRLVRGFFGEQRQRLWMKLLRLVLMRVVIDLTNIELLVGSSSTSLARLLVKDPRRQCGNNIERLKFTDNVRLLVLAKIELVLPTLRVLDFCGGKLVSLWSDQSQVPLELQVLNLQRCYKLQRVPDSIGSFRALQKLDFSECLLLKTLSEEFCNLESLEVLHLNRCLNLEYLPSGFGGMRRLRDVSLRACEKLKALPESFGLLPQIEYLDMRHCTNVKIEEGSFGSISTLKEVYLLNCRKLETFPTQLTRQPSLKKLGVATGGFQRSRGIAGLGHNDILIDIPENIGDLSMLTELRLGNLTGIPQSIGNLSQLNLISPSLDFKFTASPIPYPTAWLDVYHFQMMDTIPFVSGSSGLKCSLPAATTKERAAIIICFVSVLQLQKNELNDNQLNDNQLEWCSFSPQLRFEWFSGEKEYEDIGIKLGERIHLKILSAEQHTDLGESSGLNVFMKTMSSSVKGYFKCGWFKIIRKGEEKLIQQICGDFFRELRRQRPWALARASAASQLDLGNVHALDIANCTIRRTLYLYKTPIQEEKMELVLRKKQLFWRDDKELEHLDLSIMNTTSIPLFLTLKSIVNLYNMEVIISVRSVEAYKDKLQEYQDNSRMEHYACMLDLLGYVGHLDEVRDLIEKMPLQLGVSVGGGGLLGACKIQCNVDLGELVAEFLFDLDPQKAGYCILMSNIYVVVRRWDDVEKVGTMMNDRGVKTIKGCISIEVNNTIHTFLMGDITSLVRENLCNVGDLGWEDGEGRICA